MMPGAFQRFKNYRMRVLSVLEKYNPKYIFHNHAFEWVFGGNEESCPTGIEIIRFKNEATARAAVAELEGNEIKEMEKEVFSRVRCYFSRYAPPTGLKDQVDI